MLSPSKSARLWSTKEMSEIGHKYKFEGLVSLEGDGSDGDADTPASGVNSDQDEVEPELDWTLPVPEVLCQSKALSWVKTVLICTRGRELPGNFNPLLIVELFWEQSENWQELAEDHLQDVSKLCSNFVIDLLRDICPADVPPPRVQASVVEESLKSRMEAGEAELKKLLQDRKRWYQLLIWRIEIEPG